MPDKCMFCGEMAVVEEMFGSGSMQLICVECGSLAVNTPETTSTNDNDESITFLDRQSIDLSNDADYDEAQGINDNDNCRQPQQSSSNICSSCGIDLEDNDDNDRQRFNNENNNGNNNDGLCLDCSQLEEASDYDKSCSSLSYAHPKRFCFDNDRDDSTTSNSLKPDLSYLELQYTNSNVPSNSTSTSNLNLSKYSSVPSCSSCNSTRLTLEGMSGDERLICNDCGMVNSEAILANPITEEGYQNPKFRQSAMPRFVDRHTIRVGCKAGLDRIDFLVRKFCFSSTVRSEAEDLYKTVFEHPQVLHKTITTKEALAAVCLFIVCRRNDIPLFLHQFKQHVSNYTLFLNMKNMLAKRLGLKVPELSVTKCLTDTIDNSDIVKTSKINLTAKVMSILFLFRKAWLSDGRSRSGIITMAFYFAYMSTHGFIPRSKFCIKYDLRPPRPNLAAECHELIVKLAQHLPWITTTTKKNKIPMKLLPKSIDSILQYKESLFYLVFQPEESVSVVTSQLVADVEADILREDNDNNNINNGKDNSTIENPPEYKSIYRQKLLKVDWEKEVLLPPAAKRVRIDKCDCDVDERLCFVPDNVDLESTELKEDEFQDEIDSYILTEEEQERVREPKLFSMVRYM